MTEAAKPYELPPPDDTTQAKLDSIAHSNALKPASQDHVRFYSRSKKNAAKSAAEGRPIFEPLEYVEILTPGDKDTIIDRPVRNIDRYVWSQKYVAFRNGQAQVAAGTPLSAWEGVTPERVEELKHFRVSTVEQLAGVPDSTLPNLGPHARSEREKARAYLDVMKGKAPFDELRNENAALKARLEALEKAAEKKQAK